MERDRRFYRVLVLEDNQGDFVLIEDFLEEQMLAPEIIWAQSYADAQVCLRDRAGSLDVILLDLSLPDLQGQALIQAVLEHSLTTPVIVLTGYSELEFGFRSLALGVSDYLLKDELSALTLYKSIRYSLERKKHMLELASSEHRYSELFQLNPQPMWVFDLETLRFLNVNQAAIQHYGYTEAEFLSMSLSDIRPPEDLSQLQQELEGFRAGSGLIYHGAFRHQKKNREIIQVELKTSQLNYMGRPARLALANDVTKRYQYVQTIEEQNRTFREITWMQSHVVRAPLARIMGLIQLIGLDVPEALQDMPLQDMLNSAHELDDIIRSIVKKAEMAHEVLAERSPEASPVVRPTEAKD
ncbi:MAG: histidine kinase [Candidatus Melainabacteria bacterium HGW-Melainabacteria-1]|nr:MAG: histidine kinase [Candidatus Melainabacteria bacterium HGW-Melainabacteria-1]